MYSDCDPFVAEQAERTLAQLLALLHSQWISLAGDMSGLPYGDKYELRTRLNMAELTPEDENYLVAVGNAIIPRDADLTKLRERLLTVDETGFTPKLVGLLFEILPNPTQRPLRCYTTPGYLQLFQVLYLLLLRCGFWSVKHDQNGPIDTLALGVDPLHVPDHTVESFRARQVALKGIDELTDMDSHLHWNVLQVLPRLMDDKVANFLRAYEEWRAEEIENAGLDEDGFE